MEERKFQQAERKCLRCGNSFISEGFHNRICNECKKDKAWKEGCTQSQSIVYPSHREGRS